jgi:hypothetical protein
MQHVEPQPRPLGELFKELANETGVLVKKEVELAKTEMTAKVTSMAKDALVVVIGLAFAVAGAVALFAGVILILGIFLPLWLSAVIVGVVALGMGAAFAVGGVMALKQTDPIPHATIATLKENKRWIQEEARR